LGAVELQGWFGNGYRMLFKHFLPAVDALHQSAGTRCAAVLVGAFLRTPSGNEPVLGSGKAVLQTRKLSLLAGIFLLPAFTFSHSAFAVPGVSVSIDPDAFIMRWVQVNNGFCHICEQCPVVGHDHDTAGTSFELGAQEVQAGSVE